MTDPDARGLWTQQRRSSTRRAWAVAAVLPLLVPAAARAGKVVAVTTSEIAAYGVALEGFKREWEGEVVVVDLPKGATVDAKTARRIVDSEPDVILAIGSKAAASLKQQVKEVPIVFSMVLSPGKRGLGEGNVTGVRLEIPPGEQLRQFKRVVPKAKRVGIVFNPEKTGKLVADAEKAAGEHGVRIVRKEIASTADVPDAVEQLMAEVDALWLIPDATVVTQQTFKHILVTSLGRKIPLLVFSAAFVKAGALVGVAPNYGGIGQEAARLAKSIDAGQAASSLEPRDPPSSLVINERTAERLGLTLDPALLDEAALVR